MDSIIKLNVGGVIFMARKETLIKSLYFCELLENSKNAEKEIFIDRSPHIFKHVLSYMRDDTYTYPKKYKSELKYFQLIDESSSESEIFLVSKRMLFIGGLDDITNCSDLKDHYEQYGPILSCSIESSCGFIEFENERDAQVAIITARSNDKYKSRWYKKLKDENTLIFIGNFLNCISREDILMMLSRYGSIKSYILEPNYGFVIYKEPRETVSSIWELNGRPLDGKILTVKIFHKQSLTN